MLSPYLRHRIVSETEVLQALLSRFKPETCDKFTQEVFWRGYFKGWLEHRPYVWQQYQADVLAQLEVVARDGDLAKRYNAAITGKTGIGVFDSWARELTSDGYLHNHARMWLASIWIFTLRLPWQLGADWFLQHLLDGDPASNTCSWRWVAGLHTRGKAYLARAENIERYAPRFLTGDGRAGLSGLATSAPPIVEVPDLLARPREKPDWPDAGRARSRCDERSDRALLLHDDDLGAGDTSAYAAVAALAPSFLSPAGHPDQVLDFRRLLAEDAVNEKSSGAQPRPALLDDHEVANWLRIAGINRVTIPYAPVGPTATRLAGVVHALTHEQFDVQIILRPYDALVWPHAKAGFFRLGQKIPALLDALGPELHSR